MNRGSTLRVLATLAASMLLYAGLASAADPVVDDQAAARTLSYVFASELGSGVYEMSGRNLQVYRVIPSRQLFAPGESAPGIRVFAPITVGLYDFAPQDVLEQGLPSGIDSFSLNPGIALDFGLGHDWYISPYISGGASFAGEGLDGWLYGAGVRITRIRQWGGGELENRHELTYAGVSWRHEIPNERFVRLRQGVGFSRGLGLRMRGYELIGGPYGIMDVIIDSPPPALADAEQEALQFEFGATFSTRPGLQIWRFGAPRLGLGYRLAGELSGFRLVIGSAF